MRYRSYGQLDDPPLLDGDEGFSGILTRQDPDVLEPSLLSWGSNIRLDNGAISPRKTTRGITSQSDATTMEDDFVFDAIRFNDTENADDFILSAGRNRAYLHTTDDGDNNQEINYPSGHTINQGFLLQTSVNTMLFGDSAPSLNFKLHANGTSLGSAVLRLRDFVNYNGIQIDSNRPVQIDDTVIFNKNFSLEDQADSQKTEFDPSDVGRQIIALQNIAGRGLVQGSVYTITKLGVPFDAEPEGTSITATIDTTDATGTGNDPVGVGLNYVHYNNFFKFNDIATPLSSGDIASVVGFESSFVYEGDTFTNAPIVVLSDGRQVILPMDKDASSDGVRTELYPVFWDVVSADSGRDFAFFKQQEVRDISVSGTTFSCTTKSDHGFREGELIKFEGATAIGAFKVVSVDGPQFVFEASDTQPRSVSSGQTGIVYSISDECPSADFATWAGNRLIVPVGNDDIMISSPLSTHDFPITNRLTIASADSGNITALEPMQDDSLVVFKDNSVFLVTGVFSMLPADQGGSLSINRISDQLGCVSRNAVQVVGQEIMFLSRQGLYALTLNAKGQGAIGLPPQAVRITDMPLSKDIQDVFEKGVPNESRFDLQGLNFEGAQLEFYKGRVYVLSSEGYMNMRRTEQVTQILVFNTLLGRWESIDVYRGGGMKLIPMTRTGSRLILLHSYEGLLELEKHENVEDEYNSDFGNEHLVTYFNTRGYRNKTFGNKHYRSLHLSWTKSTQYISDPTLFSDPNQEQFRIRAVSSSPHSVNEIYDKSRTETEEIGSHFSRIKMRQRGESVMFMFNTQRVRYEVKRIAVEATEASRNIKEF